MATDNKLSNILHIFCSLTFEKYSELRNTKNLKDFSNASKFQQNYAKSVQKYLCAFRYIFSQLVTVKSKQRSGLFPECNAQSCSIEIWKQKISCCLEEISISSFANCKQMYTMKSGYGTIRLGYGTRYLPKLVLLPIVSSCRKCKSLIGITSYFLLFTAPRSTINKILQYLSEA